MASDCITGVGGSSAVSGKTTMGAHSFVPWFSLTWRRSWNFFRKVSSQLGQEKRSPLDCSSFKCFLCTLTERHLNGCVWGPGLSGAGRTTTPQLTGLCQVWSLTQPYFLVLFCTSHGAARSYVALSSDRKMQPEVQVTSTKDNYLFVNVFALTCLFRQIK